MSKQRTEKQKENDMKLREKLVQYHQAIKEIKQQFVNDILPTEPIPELIETYTPEKQDDVNELQVPIIKKKRGRPKKTSVITTVLPLND